MGADYLLCSPRGLRRPSPGLMARPCVPVGGRVKKLRAVSDRLTIPYLTLMGEEGESL